MSWPQQGKIVFTDFSLKYQPHLQLVLKNINLTINPGEKIGIVGRTGAGKSSLVKSLFRLVPEGTTGSITIDGLDISSIGLGDLRPRLGIIPQESTILNGSYRENLDPMNEFSIEDIWAAAIKSQLVEVVKQPRDYTNLETEEYYDNAAKLKQWRQAGYLQKIKLLLTGKKPNFESQIQQRRTLLDMDVCGPRNQLSNGQKQLFSLCRLLMHQHKIAILDEATASMDLEADRKLQKIIHTELKECTVLTIAHRLETVMNSDRIIVIHQGEVVEIGAPAELAQKQGHFAELLKCNNFGE
ncbi:Canalicular multispecific organic anion transporter 1 [Coemansia brasiliensis]|uniref:Canalicular multispecific organic anion transporter 1 n=1 Tax=Coemansia brasiliensis TaxID=2650707 RepID=A0A9W8I623_9FUNG|nr:Canalicular multispecific organic anion transporter 1 [Coemansia brasiliensis]